MPILSEFAKLALRPKRVLVCATSGCGKTTLAQHIGTALSLPTTELDALYHGPNWTPRPTFFADVVTILQDDSWVMEWQYDLVRSLLLDRCDLIVWLDLPHLLTAWQITVRTVSRRLRHQELWNGNFEPPLHTIFWNHEHVIRWSWSTRHLAKELVHQALARHPSLPILQLHSHRSADRWIAGILTHTET